MDDYVKSFFPQIARLWNSLPGECFPLYCDLNSVNPKVNRHLLYLGFFKTAFLLAFNIFLLVFLVVAVQPYMK